MSAPSSSDPASASAPDSGPTDVSIPAPESDPANVSTPARSSDEDVGSQAEDSVSHLLQRLTGSCVLIPAIAG
jgi:division protein CdvB (Snf7/Vps24/ESCRT-III family)